MFEPGDIVYYLSADADYKFHILRLTVVERDLDKYKVESQFGIIYVPEEELYETAAEAIDDRKAMLYNDMSWLKTQLEYLEELENEI